MSTDTNSHKLIVKKVFTCKQFEEQWLLQWVRLLWDESFVCTLQHEPKRPENQFY
jgi:hypothetical protein